MTDDIVTRLNYAIDEECDPRGCDLLKRNCECFLYLDSLNEIVRLRAEVARLNTFLHPIGVVVNQAVRGE